MHEFVSRLSHTKNKQTRALGRGQACWPGRVRTRSAASDRRRDVELEPVVAFERCLAAVVVAVTFCNGAIRGGVGVRARTLGAGAATAGRGAAPGDSAFESGIAFARKAAGFVGICNVTRGRCNNNNNNNDNI